MEEKTVKVKFDGQSHQVDIDTFARVMLGYSIVLQEAADSVGILNPIRVCIKATEPGSLDVLISVISQASANTLDFIGDHSQGIESVIALACGAYALKQKLAGKKKIDGYSDNGDETVSINAGGDVIVVKNSTFNFYRDSRKAMDAIDKSFEELSDNPTVEAIEMSTDGDVMFRAESYEFPSIAESPNYEGIENRHISESAHLTVVKPYLASSKTRRWEFIYNGIKISATISDEEFLRKLKEYSFSVGTMMDVELDILQEFSEDYACFINKKYVISHVINVSDPIRTDSLF